MRQRHGERQTDREKGEAEIWRLEGESEREKREKAYREERDGTETFREREVQRESARDTWREKERDGIETQECEREKERDGAKTLARERETGRERET